MNMNYKEFTEKVRDGVEAATGKDVRLNAVKKNNGVVLVGITIFTEGKTISPTLYLERFYEHYKNGKSMDRIISDFIVEYEREDIHEYIDLDFFNYYEQVKPLLGVKLINADMNEALLKEVPHKEIYNFAVICYCDVPDEIIKKVGNGFITIRNEHLDVWGINAEKLIEDAIQNTQKTNPAEVINMMNLLGELSDIPLKLICDEVPMWVVTNKKRHFGAATILYDNCFEHIAEIVKEDYYVLPSSIHEVIILPKRYRSDKDDLVNMVREINEEQLDTEELLANNVYFYSIDTKELQIIE